MTIEQLKEVIDKVDDAADLYVIVEDAYYPITDAKVDGDGDLVIQIDE